LRPVGVVLVHPGLHLALPTGSASRIDFRAAE
jgi:hypothetical protein